jgi:hypothetical protein
MLSQGPDQQPLLAIDRRGAESRVDILFARVRGQTGNNGLSVRSFPRDLDRRQKTAKDPFDIRPRTDTVRLREVR